MKKLFLIVLFLLCVKATHAQEIAFQTNLNTSRINIEHIDNIGKHNLYVYGELAHNKAWMSYIQLFYEYECFKKLYTHIEFRNIDEKEMSIQSYIAGATYNVFSNDYSYINVSALYRYETAHMWQTSAVYGVSYKALSFSGYCDVYGVNFVNIYSENKIKVNLNKAFVGVNIEFSRFDKTVSATPYIMLGFKL